VTLSAAETIRGRLIDLQGQPAGGVKVHVSRIGATPARDGMYRAILVDGLGHGVEEDETSPEQEKATQMLLGSRVMMSNGQMMVTVGANGDPAPAPTVSGVVFSDPASTVAHWPEPVTTDADGYFTIRGVSRAQGLGLQIRDDRFALQSLDLPAGAPNPKEAVTLPLAPARTLEGVVLASDTGKPVPNARVHVNPPQPYGSFIIAFAGLEGNGVDWKGRRRSGTGSEFFYSLALDGGHEELPTIEVLTDENGRYRVNLPLGDTANLRVSSPAGETFLDRTVSVAWKKGATRQTHDIQMPRGVPLRGRVTESGKPIAGARVDFWSKALQLPEGVRLPRSVKTGADGAFVALLPPAVWHVLVNSANSDYLCQKVPADKLTDGR
jgi:hypothetical protein